MPTCDCAAMEMLRVPCLTPFTEEEQGVGPGAAWPSMEQHPEKAEGPGPHEDPPPQFCEGGTGARLEKQST